MSTRSTSADTANACPHSADTALPEHYFNGGFTFPITNNLQFDVRAGLGLNEAADDYFLGAGGAVRY